MKTKFFATTFITAALSASAITCIAKPIHPHAFYMNDERFLHCIMRGTHSGVPHFPATYSANDVQMDFEYTLNDNGRVSQFKPVGQGHSETNKDSSDWVIRSMFGCNPENGKPGEKGIYSIKIKPQK